MTAKKKNAATEAVVVAHDQKVTHNYLVHFPAHPPREGDPHYVDFEHFRKTHKDTAKCWLGEHLGDFSGCSLDQPLELHHAHIEFSLQNGVDLAALEKDYPGVSDPNTVGAWVESADNLVFLCVFHHRGHAGAHTAAYADWEASKYVKGLIG